jgi:hypothetical protein
MSSQSSFLELNLELALEEALDDSDPDGDDALLGDSAFAPDLDEAFEEAEAEDSVLCLSMLAPELS